MYQLYNILFTAFPVIWLAVMDFEYPKEVFLAVPEYYQLGIKNMCFSTRQFWKWVFYGVW